MLNSPIEYSLDGDLREYSSLSIRATVCKGANSYHKITKKNTQNRKSNQKKYAKQENTEKENKRKMWSAATMIRHCMICL